MRWDGLGWIHRWEGVGGKEGVSLMHNFHFHVLVAGRFEPTSFLSQISCKENIYVQQLYQTQQSLWLSGSILSHEINFPGSNPTQSYCVHVKFKVNWYTFGAGDFWRNQIFIRKMTIFFCESEGKFAFFLMRYFCELNDLENFEKMYRWQGDSNPHHSCPI